MPAFPPIIINKKFSTVEEFCFWAKRWNLDFKKISIGDFYAELKLIDVGLVKVAEVKIKGVVFQNGTSPNNYRTIIISGNEMQSYKWQNYDITSDYLLVTPRDNTFGAITNESFHVYTISISNDYIEELAEKSSFKSINRKLGEKELIFPIKKNYLLYLNSYLKVLFDDLTQTELRLISNEPYSNLTEKLPEILLDYIDKNQVLQPKVKLRKMDKAALKLIEVYNNSEIPQLSISDFCHKYKIKQKTLEVGVKEFFNTSPIAFIKALQLNRFRKIIHIKHTTISEAAKECGFTHLGQLSQDYKKLFGELPSETIKKM